MSFVKIKILNSKNSMNQIRDKLESKIADNNLNIDILDNEDQVFHLQQEEEQHEEEQHQEEQHQEEQHQEVPVPLGTSQHNSKNIYIYRAHSDEQIYIPSPSVKAIKITLQAGGGGGGLGFISKDTPLFKPGTNITHSISPDTFDIGISGTGGSSGESFSKMMNINYDATLSFILKVGYGGTGATFDRDSGTKTDATSGESTWFKVTESSQFYETKGGDPALPVDIYSTTTLPWIMNIDDNSTSKIGNTGIVFPLNMESYLNALSNKSFDYPPETYMNSLLNDLTWISAGSDQARGSTGEVHHDNSEQHFIKTEPDAIVYNRGLKQLIEDYMILTTDSTNPMSRIWTSSRKTDMSFDQVDLIEYFKFLRGYNSSLASVNTGGKYIGGGSGGGGGGGGGGSGYAVKENFIFDKPAKEGKAGKSGGGGGGGGVDIIENSTQSSSSEDYGKIYYSTNGGAGGDGYIIIEEFLVPI